MKTYKVIKGRVIDVHGNTVYKGGEAKLEADKAKFYAHRIEEKKEKPKKTESDLPEGFPYAEKFSKKGLNLADFEGKSLEELQAIKGVGKSTAEDILSFFNPEEGGGDSGEDETESKS